MSFVVKATLVKLEVHTNDGGSSSLSWEGEVALSKLMDPATRARTIREIVLSTIEAAQKRVDTYGDGGVQ